MSDVIKLPPNNVNAEQALIGALLQDNSLVEQIDNLITEVDFYDYRNRFVYKTLMNLIDAGKPADVITVFEKIERELKADKSLDLGYIAELVRNTPSAINAKHYAKIISDKRIERGFLSIAARIHDLAYEDGDLSNRVEEAQSLISMIDKDSEREGPVLIRDVIRRVIENIDTRAHHNFDGITGLPSGLSDLDKKTSGFQKGDLILIAGRPGLGKTAIAMQIAQNAALSGEPVLVFSLEMRDEALVERMIANHGKINGQEIKTGKMGKESWDKISKVIGDMQDVPLLIAQGSSPGIGEIRSTARIMKRKHGLSLIVVDYIQLMNGKGDNREQQIASISRGLKILAKELDVPVIALSQLSRECEKRVDKRPSLADLRESGSLEQDADLVMFVYRDEVYYPGQSVGVAEILIRKHRMGECGDVFLVWSGEFSRFDSHAGHYCRPEKVVQMRSAFDD